MGLDNPGGNKPFGTAIIDFGLTPSAEAVVTIPQVGLPGNAHMRAWFSGNSTSDNDGPAHLLAQDMLRLVIDQCTGTNFIIHANSMGFLATGQFLLSWNSA